MASGKWSTVFRKQLGASVVACAMAAVFLFQMRPVSATTSLSPLLWLDASNSASYPGTGSIWTDLSGNSRHGTLMTGVSYNSNIRAMQFLGDTGGDSYVSLAGNMRTFTGGITIEFEADFGAVADNWERIFDFSEAVDDTVNDFFVGRWGEQYELTIEVFKEFDMSNPDKNGSSGYCHTATDETILAPTQQPTLHKWVITIDGTAPYTCRIYRDGVQIPTRLSLDGNAYSAVSAGANANGSPFMLPPEVDRPSNFIGRSNFSNDARFEGYLRYIRIYDSAYTPTQIENSQTTTTSVASTTTSPTTTVAPVRSTQLPSTGNNANNLWIALVGAVVVATGVGVRLTRRESTSR